jgi:hypothetical protein
MNNDFEVSVEQEVAAVRMKRPHVVVLGAGASRATCPQGDANGKVLPLMNDFAKVLTLEGLFRSWSIDPNQNFESVFSDLFERRETIKINQIQEAVEAYFGGLELSDKPTIYDHLVLSLRKHDLIATFNWDPLLIYAYRRSSQAGLGLPRLAFLHGNTKVGYCLKDRVTGFIANRCSKCGNPLVRTPLLYPIRTKDYASNAFIANEWKLLKAGFEDAFMITIFGYNGPKTDAEAIGAMKKAWGPKGKRNLEQTAFITIQSDSEINENWKAFIHTHHYELHSSFYDSWIANHPRRTGEAYWNQYMEAKFISNNPIPKESNLQELWRWYGQFKAPEDLAQ